MSDYELTSLFCEAIAFTDMVKGIGERRPLA
jgi:hypothetical protein